MRRVKIAVWFSLCVAVGVLHAADVNFREPVVLPRPQKLSIRADREVRIDAQTVFAVVCAESSAASWVRQKVRDWWGTDLRVDVAEPGGASGLPVGAYRISAVPGRISLEAAGLQGVRYAMYTLRQIAERDSDGETVSYYRLPALEVEDAPTISFRGIHLCWFPEVKVSLIERQIRLAAYYKYNYAVIESWGVFRSERYPWFAVRGAPMDIAEIRRLKTIADDLGIMLVPQLNVFGHAACSRVKSGKHVTIDVHPERQSLFEPDGGWNWCLSNPAARRIVRGLVEELHGAFGSPPYFHIGCDEADPPSCANCRAQSYAETVFVHIEEIRNLLERRGATAMMWHDMLLDKKDPRWAGFTKYGDSETARLGTMLSRKIVVCDWEYGQPYGGRKGMKDYPTSDYLKELGFDVVMCPWHRPADIDDANAGVIAQADYIRKRGLRGVLQTVWHHYRGQDFARMMETSACAVWNGDIRATGWSATAFRTHWRQVGWDAGIADFEDTGYFDQQVTRDILDE